MQPTTLLYMTDMHKLNETANVLDIITLEDGRTALILDQTIFYPQGGGQPYDQGTITSDNASFDVQEVRFKDGIVYHIGESSGTFQPSDAVHLSVNPARRAINNKSHTAGHIVDIAMDILGKKYIPARGYHFPEGAYVEYVGTLEETEREQLMQDLQREVNTILSSPHPVRVQMVNHEQLHALAKYVPDYLPKDKPSRVMIIEGFHAIPCGGTHVAHTQEIKQITIDKIKNKKGNLRVSYSAL